MNDVIVVRAADANGRRRNRLEVYGRGWAAAQGVPVPRVIDHDPDGGRLVSERVRSLPREGVEYLEAALESAARIAAGTPPVLPDPATTWRDPRRWRTPLRAAQLAAAGVPPALFVAERRAAARLPDEVPSHCDFHIGNVLLVDRPPGTDRAATVIDFEYLRMGPRHADAIRLFTTLASHEDAALGVDLLLRRTAAGEWPAIAVQLRWLALRPLAELITVQGGPDPVKLDRARERWRLARLWARDIDAAHRAHASRPPAIRAVMPGAVAGTGR